MTESDVRDFYENLAPEYDRMTDFRSRLERDGPVFDAIVRRFGIRRALDAGCGTGLHSILLARAGVEVTGIDISAEMVRLAAGNAARADVRIRFLRSSLSDLPRLIRPTEAAGRTAGTAGETAGGPGTVSPFDAVFCLGNTVAHLRDDASLDEALRNFRSVIRPDGRLIVQMLNYERLLARREEVINVRKAGQTTFERKYAYGKDSVTFTVSMTGPAGDRSESVTLRPLTRPVLFDALRRNGFPSIGAYGDLSLGPYTPETSPDLIAVASC